MCKGGKVFTNAEFHKLTSRNIFPLRLLLQSNMTINFESGHLRKIIAHCKREWQIEACGILVGKIKDIEGNEIMMYLARSE